MPRSGEMYKERCTPLHGFDLCSYEFHTTMKEVVQLCIHRYWLKRPHSRSGDQCPGGREKGVEVGRLADARGLGRGGRAEADLLGWRSLVGGIAARGVAPPLVAGGVGVEDGASHRLLPRPLGCVT